ncbi:MAG: hypothetical protein HRT35_31170 [Algicola sp.]|nr:hypothetical protein [Algicola sp.]
MACFTQKSLDTLVNSILAACNKSLKNPDVVKVLNRNASKFDRLGFGTILTSTIAADIGEKWLSQLKPKSELNRCIRLLCYYQIPYPKATTFNVLCSGLLLCCDLVTQKLKAKALSSVLANGLSDQRFALNLAVNLQRMLPLGDMKSNAMCIRPKFYKPEPLEQHEPLSLEYQFQRITEQYMPWLKKSFLSMGYYPTLNASEVPPPPRPATGQIAQMEWDISYEDWVSPNAQAMEKAQKLFNYSVEGGMNENEAEAMLDAIFIAEDILNVGENWFNFSADDKTCRNKEVISNNIDTQKTVKVIISEMFDLQTLDKDHLKEGTGRATDFFDKVFGKTILENVHQDYTKGDPVQFRLFSVPDSTDESSLNEGDATAGLSNIRECHLLPLSKGTKFTDESAIDFTPSGRRRRGAKDVYKSRKQRLEDNFFSQMAAGSSYLNRMVVRIRVDSLIHEIRQDKALGRNIYVNNRFGVALTIVHELMHTYYAMVDFYYRDLSFPSSFTTETLKGPVSYCGLSLGKHNTSNGSIMSEEVANSVYPKGDTFDLSHYNWQINNVDNYMVLLTKLYLMDDELVKIRYQNGDKNAITDKAALAVIRLNALTFCRDDAATAKEPSIQEQMMYQLDYSSIKEAKKSNMAYLSKIEELCWTRKDNRYLSIIKEAQKTNSISSRFG